jgi:hypothetical protein
VNRLGQVALAALAATLIAFAAWQYAMPDSFQSSLQLDHPGIDHFRRALGVPRPVVGEVSYRTVFRALLGAIWAAYLVLVAAAVRGARVGRRVGSGVAVALALLLGLFWPASFSTDVYAYVGYGRLAAVHHLNPYLTTQKALVDLGDPTAPFLRWNIASPYGPLWTWLSVAVAWALRGAGLLAAVMTMKLCAAAGGLALAAAGRRLAERLEPGRGEVAFLALALNPLLLIEGAGNGHNDVVMMALVLGGLAALGRGRAYAGALAVGCAAAVKLIPLLLVPWIVVVAGRASRRRAPAVLVLVLALAPLAIAYAPFWRGAATLAGVYERWARGQHQQHVVSTATALVVVSYAATSIWLFARPELRRLVSAWIVAAGAVLVAGTGLWLPWYLAWPWSASLTRWDARHTGVSYFLFAVAVAFTWRYSMVIG